jgi:polyisoprenoid-binding protein YceI
VRQNKIGWDDVKHFGSSSVEPSTAVTKFHVLDSEVSGGNKATSQETMQSVQVLDGGHLLEIHFQSIGVEAIGTDRWIVHGNLDLHGQTRGTLVEWSI